MLPDRRSTGLPRPRPTRNREEGTTPVRFTVKDVFHLRHRGVVLASGLLTQGSIAGGMTLYEERTGLVAAVLGIELMPVRPEDPDRVTLIVDPSSPARLAPGVVLVSAS